MRILLVSQEYPPETGWGGIGTYTWMLGQGLRELGHEVHVLSVTPNTPATDEMRDGVIVHRRPLRRVRGLGRLTKMPRTVEQLVLSYVVFRAFRRLHFRHPFDVVEFPNWKAEAFFFLRRRPVASTMRLHSMAFQLFQHMGMSKRDARWAQWMEEDTVRRVDVAHAPQLHLRSVAARLGLDPRWTREIPAPVQLVEDPGPASFDPPRILFAGRFEPRKNPEVVIRAAPKVLARFPSVRFVFVGRDGASGGHDSYLDWMRSIAEKLGVSNSIEIIDGWQEDAVRLEMPKAAVVVVPSRSESFGYVAAEAASYSRAVVASRVDGLSQLVEVGITGNLAAPEDPDEWSAALIDMVEDPKGTIAMGANGRRFVESNLTPPVIAALISEACEAAKVRHASRT
ncbi:MAG: glycosyltransferase family 4 protein [Actinomycetota bacterium]